MARKEIKVERRLYVDKDRKRICFKGDPEAAFLFAAAGTSVGEKELEGLEIPEGAFGDEVEVEVEDNSISIGKKPEVEDDEQSEVDLDDTVEAACDAWKANDLAEIAGEWEISDAGNKADVARRLALAGAFDFDETGQIVKIDYSDDAAGLDLSEVEGVGEDASDAVAAAGLRSKETILIAGLTGLRDAGLSDEAASAVLDYVTELSDEA